MAVRTATLPNAEPRTAPAPGRDTGRAATLAVASLVVLPLLAYAVPSLFGHPVAPGDDMTQSLPLRELVGRDLAAGHLPVFDPYLWSGTPLLAGWNAGAAYPFTWLFAVLPGTAAWTVTLVSTVVTAGVSCYAFLRANALGVVASWLGALTFAFGGGMSAQVAHIGLVAGMAWVPLALLAVLRLTELPSGTGGGSGRWAGGAGPGGGAGRWAGGPGLVAAPGRTGGLGPAAGWTAVLAAAVGMAVLAGEPRAVADAAVVLVLYGGWRLLRLAGSAQRAGRPGAAVAWGVAGVVAGGALGVGLGAVQLLPGLAAVATSQRAAVTSFLFSAGSLPASWLLLLGVPDLLGGSGSFGQPRFFAPYNLTEVTGYVGMLPLVAAGSMLGRLRRREPLPEWTVWLVVAAAGVVLALGSNTPLWHVLIRIPLFGGQRLQSRSILVTGLALAVLLAYWADGWIAGHAPAEGGGRPGDEQAGLGRGGRGGCRSARRHLGDAPSWREPLLGSLLPVAVVVAVAAALAWRVPLLEWMHVPRAAAESAGGIGPWLVPFMVLAGAAVAVEWVGWRAARGGTGRRREHGHGRRTRSAVLIAFVVVDLAVFATTSVIAVAGSSPSASPAAVAARAPAGAGGARAGAGSGAPAAAGAALSVPVGGAARRETTSVAARPIATLHLRGRFAVYDPTLRDGGQLSVLGVTDANVVAGTYSAEGYGSIVNGRYADATGTHGVSGGGQDVFAPKAAAGGAFDALDTTDVLVPGSYLVVPAGPGAPGGSTGPGGRSDGRTTAPGRRATWELGTPLAVTGVLVQGRVQGAAQVGTTPTPGPAPGASGVKGTVRIGLALADGRVTWSSRTTPARRGLGWRAEWPAPVRAVGVVVATATAAALAPPVVTTASGASLRPAGALDAALAPPHWTYAGRDGAFAVYRNLRARPPLTLEAVRGGSLAGATVTRTAGPALAPAAARVTSPHGVWVVRSVDATPGWSATWTPTEGRGRTVGLVVHRDGIVQSVRVPPGRGTLTWRYQAPGLVAGVALSGVALVAVLALAVVAALAVVERRRLSGARGRGPQAPRNGAAP